MSFLHVDHVTHTYFSLKEKTTAVKDIHLHIEKGDFISFLGPSGCGKTTLLSILAGLIAPAQGRVLIEGSVPNHKEHQIGYMLQQDYLFPWKSIEENVLLGLHISKTLTEEKKAEVLGLLPKLGLIGVEKKISERAVRGNAAAGGTCQNACPGPGPAAS
ncbi:ATP-binding cassette domain-containing protein [Bacillus amyloliquefaciens]|uniref:ATP-binding cassette domain-containing protein n=1 Tax=Bacillus amyloliquefaciens TaxID=1390 RepID=UPI002174FA0D